METIGQPSKICKIINILTLIITIHVLGHVYQIIYNMIYFVFVNVIYINVLYININLKMSCSLDIFNFFMKECPLRESYPHNKNTILIRPYFPHKYNSKKLRKTDTLSCSGKIKTKNLKYIFKVHQKN